MPQQIIRPPFSWNEVFELPGNMSPTTTPRTAFNFPEGHVGWGGEAALLQDLTFFSHINSSKVAKNIHDEYWHRHIDAEQYGTFAYTTLLYLSTAQDGSFGFHRDPNRP